MDKPIRRSLQTAMFAAFIAFAAHARESSAQALQQSNWDMKKVEDGEFRCPDTLPTVAGRTHEVEDFLSWTKKHHPSWTTAQILEFRAAVLKYYGCSKTLHNIQAD